MGQERILEDYTATVFVSKFNNVFHSPNCSKIEDFEGLIRFDTPQKANEAGYLPCNYCNPS